VAPCELDRAAGWRWHLQADDAGRTIDEEGTVSDELLEVTEKQTLRREDAAARLRDLADQLARHNQVAFVREGVRYTAAVPDEVEMKVEIELGEDSEIEIEISW
jgi:amphi-Trp domain-containing protein